MSQNCQDQYNWLSTTLANVPDDDWLIIVGHHPIDETDVMDFTSLIQKHGFSIYLNGKLLYTSMEYLHNFCDLEI